MLRGLFMYACTKTVTTGPIRLVPSLKEAMFMHMHRELALLVLIILIPPTFFSV